MPPLAPRFRVRLLLPLAAAALHAARRVPFHSILRRRADWRGQYSITNAPFATARMARERRSTKKLLSGTKSLAQLQDVIAKTMPEDDPGTLPTKDSQLVASFIYDAYFGRSGAGRNRPARTELAWLTVRQHRMTVADFAGSFRSQIYWNEKAGPQGRVFQIEKNRQFHLACSSGLTRK